VDLTGGLDVPGFTITSNAFWGEFAAGTWTLQIQDIKGKTIGTIKNWSLTFIGNNAATVQAPLVYTPEFAALATAAREVVKPGTSTTIDLIALPGATTINLNGGVSDRRSRRDGRDRSEKCQCGRHYRNGDTDRPHQRRQ
jgi:hypothetical protein